MHTCARACVCMCMCVCVSTNIDIYTYIYIYIYIMCVHTYIYVCAGVCVCVCVCVGVSKTSTVSRYTRQKSTAFDVFGSLPSCLQLIMVRCAAVTVTFLVPVYYRCVILLVTRESGTRMFATKAVEMALIIVTVVEHGQRYIVACCAPGYNARVAFAFALVLVEVQDRLRLVWAVVPSFDTPRRFAFSRAQPLGTGFSAVAREPSSLRILKFEMRVFFIFARVSSTWVPLAVASAIVPHDSGILTR